MKQGGTSYGSSTSTGRTGNLFSTPDRYGSAGGYRPYSSYSSTGTLGGSSGLSFTSTTSPMRGSEYPHFTSTHSSNPPLGFGHVTSFPKTSDTGGGGTRTSTSSTMNFSNTSAGGPGTSGGMYAGSAGLSSSPPRFGFSSMPTSTLSARQKEAQIAKNLAKVEPASLQMETEDGWILAEERELEFDADCLSKMTAKDKQTDKEVKLRWAPRGQAVEPKEGNRCLAVGTVLPVAQAVLGQITKYRENCATATFLSNLLEELATKNIPPNTVLGKTIEATQQAIVELGSEIDAEGGVSGFLTSVTKWGKEFALAASVEKQLCKCITQLQTAMLCHSLK